MRHYAFDLIAGLGALLLFAGLWLLAPWLGLSVLGLLLLTVGILGAKLWGS